MNKPELEGLVGNVYEVTIAHQSVVGDERQHDDIEEKGKCWCWEEKL